MLRAEWDYEVVIIDSEGSEIGTCMVSEIGARTKELGRDWATRRVPPAESGRLW